MAIFKGILVSDKRSSFTRLYCLQSFSALIRSTLCHREQLHEDYTINSHKFTIKIHQVESTDCPTAWCQSANDLPRYKPQLAWQEEFCRCCDAF